ncbi:hypothetical protein GCM10018783_72200 [Streptomyces griseosporeus]|nr:hypothetical protein GCM10018783_72200 [Streptomyces griseosporeus]
MRRAVRWPLLISSDSTARSASVKDGMAVARTGAACMGEVPPRSGGTWSDTRVTDWCYQGVTDRSNASEASLQGRARPRNVRRGPGAVLISEDGRDRVTSAITGR